VAGSFGGSGKVWRRMPPSHTRHPPATVCDSAPALHPRPAPSPAPSPARHRPRTPAYIHLQTLPGIKALLIILLMPAILPIIAVRALLLPSRLIVLVEEAWRPGGLCRSGGRVGMEAQRPGGRVGLQVVEIWRSWRSGSHEGMEPQRSRDLEVWRLWRSGGEVWRSGGRVGLEV
jgi:hypothetical protein